MLLCAIGWQYNSEMQIRYLEVHKAVVPKEDSVITSEVTIVSNEVTS